MELVRLGYLQNVSTHAQEQSYLEIQMYGLGEISVFDICLLSKKPWKTNPVTIKKSIKISEELWIKKIKEFIEPAVHTAV